MAHQFDMYTPAPLRYLTMVGGSVLAFDTHDEAVAFVEGQRAQGVTGYAYAAAQMFHGGEWQEKSRQEWGRGEKLSADSVVTVAMNHLARY